MKQSKNSLENEQNLGSRTSFLAVFSIPDQKLFIEMSEVCAQERIESQLELLIAAIKHLKFL